MVQSTYAVQRVPLWIASIWLFCTIAAIAAVPILWVSMPYWHDVRMYLQWLGQIHAWVAIAACVGLLVLSQRQGEASAAAWAQGAVPIYVLGGLLSALVLHFGVWLQWLAQPQQLRWQLLVWGLAAVHGVCAVFVFRHIRAVHRAGSMQA